jgi:hypothetical protein
MFILDSTVFLAAIDASRSLHHAARKVFSSGRPLAVTTQTIREALSVATRSMSANGLGMDFTSAWKSITAMRISCGRMLYENEKWWISYVAISQQVQPTGRTLYDLGQIAHVMSLGPPTQLLTDDVGIVTRYGKIISVMTLSDL